MASAGRPIEQQNDPAFPQIQNRESRIQNHPPRRWLRSAACQVPAERQNPAEGQFLVYVPSQQHCHRFWVRSSYFNVSTSSSLQVTQPLESIENPATPLPVTASTPRPERATRNQPCLGNTLREARRLDHPQARFAIQLHARRGERTPDPLPRKLGRFSSTFQPSIWSHRGPRPFCGASAVRKGNGQLDFRALQPMVLNGTQWY